MHRKRVGILIYPEVEVLDFAGPYEVFSVTRLDEERRREQPSPFEVFVVAEGREPVTATGGLRVLPEHDLSSCPPLDVLVVPGGWGSRKEADNPRLIEWVRHRAGTAELTASVCTGSFLLGRAGLLAGKRATTHWRSLDRLAEAFPDVIVERCLHVVEDGSVFSSAGIAAGIDLSLRIVARYHGEIIARATARHMEHPYPTDNTRRV